MSDVLKEAQTAFKHISNTNFTAEESIGGYYCQFNHSILVFKEDVKKVRKALDLLEEKEKGVKTIMDKTKSYWHNVLCGKCEERISTRGIFDIKDIYCSNCGTKVDWSDVYE